MSSIIMEHNCALSLANPTPQNHHQHGAVGLCLTHQPSFEIKDDDPSHSSSSAAITGPDGPAEDESAHAGPAHSDCSLKEHDYIGMAEVSSVPSPAHESEDMNEAELNLAETDLRLGLAPSVLIENQTLDVNKNEGVGIDRVCQLKKNELFDVNAPLSIPATWHDPLQKNMNLHSSYHLNGYSFPATNNGIGSKNGSKRLYADTILVDSAARESRTALVARNSLMPNASISTGDIRLCVSLPSKQAISTEHFQGETKSSQAKYSQNLYWSASAPKASSLQSQNGNAFNAMPLKVINFASGSSADKDHGDQLSFKNDISKAVNMEYVHDDAPPSKGQVVGWPPVPSYRRSCRAARSKLSGDDGDALYVKVNMDGIPIGRKIDLIAYNSYEGLLAALEEMFHGPSSGHGARPVLNGSDYVLTYEDKEGDWMLVGDVPWGMFVSTVRRLRISRGSDISGGGS